MTIEIGDNLTKLLVTIVVFVCLTVAVIKVK